MSKAKKTFSAGELLEHHVASALAQQARHPLSDKPIVSETPVGFRNLKRAVIILWSMAWCVLTDG